MSEIKILLSLCVILGLGLGILHIRDTIKSKESFIKEMPAKEYRKLQRDLPRALERLKCAEYLEQVRTSKEEEEKERVKQGSIDESDRGWMHQFLGGIYGKEPGM